MKRSATILIVVLAAVAAIGLVFLPADGQAQMGRGGMMGPGYGSGMGPGMMHGYGYRQLEKPLQKKDAEQMFKNYIQSLYNPDLKAGKITEKDNYFEGEILTKDNKLVDTIFVDKNTGWMSTAMGGRGGYGYGMGPGMMGPGYGYGMGPGMMGGGGYGVQQYCPYCGSYVGPYGMGPGMMGPGYGYGMGSGMMGRGYGPGMMGPGYQGYGQQYQGSQGTLKEKDVKAMLDQYVQSTRNPNLKVGKITEKDTYFEGEILTKNNALVDKVLVDKNTGWMRSIYQ